jgi:hypothetical protein
MVGWKGAGRLDRMSEITARAVNVNRELLGIETSWDVGRALVLAGWSEAWLVCWSASYLAARAWSWGTIRDGNLPGCWQTSCTDGLGSNCGSSSYLAVVLRLM